MDGSGGSAGAVAEPSRDSAAGLGWNVAVAWPARYDGVAAPSRSGGASVVSASGGAPGSGAGTWASGPVAEGWWASCSRRALLRLPVAGRFGRGIRPGGFGQVSATVAGDSRSNGG